MQASLFNFIESNVSIALTFGITAFILQLFAYVWYSFEFFRNRVHLNIASWFIWFTTGLVEYITFDAIDSSFATSALPIACLIGIIYMGGVVFYLHIYRSITRTQKFYFVEIELSDLVLICFAVLSYGILVTTTDATLANILIVGASLLSFIPMWRASLEYGDDHPGPWIIMCVAYVAMLGAILAEGSEQLLAQSFYPVYFFILHLIVALLAIKAFRSKVKEIYYKWQYKRRGKQKRIYGKQ